MDQVIQLFKQIQETSSTNDKKKIIEENKDNELFKKCLKFLLDGNITTGIAERKYETLNVMMSDWKHNDINNEFAELLDYITKHNTGKDEDVLMVQSWCYDMSDEVKKFVKGMITKSIKLGANAKLVNKAIPDLIPVFNVMLGESIEKVKLKGDEKIFISHKLNGCRAAYIGNKIMTRQGKEYNGLEHIITDLQELVGMDTFVDGELLYKNDEGLSDSNAFQKGTGIAMSKDKDKSCLKYVIFDVLPLEEFWNGKSSDTYSVRKQKLLNLKDKIHKLQLKNLEIVEMFYEGYDHSEIWKWLDYAELHDFEGCMINLDTPYECKRTKNLIKVKQFKECDILCTGLIQGKGRNKNTMGSIECDYKGYKVGVNGFSDELKNRYWNNPGEIVGKIVQVRYKEETRNKKGEISIQFPSFQCIRHDKTEPSYED